MNNLLNNEHGRENWKRVSQDEFKRLKSNELIKARVRKLRAMKNAEIQNKKFTRQERKNIEEEQARQREQWWVQKAQ